MRPLRDQQVRSTGGLGTASSRAAVCDLLCDELERPLSMRLACMAVGASEQMVYNWKKRAREGDDEAIQLVRKLAAAQARGAKKAVGKLWEAAEQGDTRALTFLLERVYPQDFGPISHRPAAEYVQVEEPYEESEQARLERQYSTKERIEGLVRLFAELGLVAPRGEQAAVEAEAEPASAAEQTASEAAEPPSLAYPPRSVQ
jgi:hypothetical protein